MRVAARGREESSWERESLLGESLLGAGRESLLAAAGRESLY